MAYAYSAIDDLMGNNQAQKQNIFSQPAQGAANPNDVTSGGQEPKTSAEGDVGSSVPGGPAATSTAPKVQDTGGATAQNKTAQAAYKANAGKTQAPSTLNDISTRIGTAQSGLEKQASDYAADQAAKHNYALDNSVAEKAVKDQDTAAQGNVLGLIGRASADPIENFKAQGTDVKDVDLLNTPAGIKNLVSRGRSPTYSSNMAAFDSMLLQADPNFQRQVAQIKGQAGDLTRSVAATTTKAQADAEAAAQANLAKSKQDITDYLLGYQGNITSAEQQAADAANAGLPAQIEAAKAKAAADLKSKAEADVRARLSAEFGGSRSEAQLQAALSGIDPTQYLDFIKGYTPDQFINQDQANQFNTINALLGNGGQAQMASSGLPDLYSTRSDDLYNSVLGSAESARKAQDTQNQSKIQSILDAANAAAQKDNERRQGLVGSYSNDVNNIAQQMLKSGQISGYNAGDMQSQLIKSIQDYIAKNPAKTSNLTGSNVLTKEQADQLNALARDSGALDTYQAGTGKLGGNSSFINQDALKAALQDTVSNFRPTGSTAPQYTPFRFLDQTYQIQIPEELRKGTTSFV